jgi:predicted MFS family arabinose efflux permease
LAGAPPLFAHNVAVKTETLLNARLWLAFVLMLFVSGFSNTFPVFFPPLLEEFGGSRAATAATVSLLWMGGALVGALAGYLVARHNPRWVVIAGIFAMVLGLTLGTLAPSLPWFVGVVGGLGGIGVGFTGMVTQAALLADAYARRRGLANGIAFSGSMAGYLVALPAQMVIARSGWRGAFVAYIVILLLLVPLVWRILPARLGSTAGASSAGQEQGTIHGIVARPAFWVLMVLFLTPPLVAYLATMQHALYFRARGFSPDEASAMLTVGGVLSTSGRVLAGLATDRFGAPAAGVLSFLLSLVGLICLLGMEGWPSRLLAYVSVFFVFLPIGSRATIVSVLVSRIAPRAHYGPIFGLLGIGNSVGAGLGPILSGAIYDRTHSYAAIYLTATGVLLVGLAALIAFVAMTRPRGAP